MSECCCSYGTPFSNILGASIIICPIIEHSKWRKTDQQAFLQLISLSLSLSLVISDSSQYFIIILHHSTLSIHQAMEKHYFLTVMEIVGMVHEVASQDKDSWLWLLKKNFNDRRWGLRYD